MAEAKEKKSAEVIEKEMLKKALLEMHLLIQKFLDKSSPEFSVKDIKEIEHAALRLLELNQGFDEKNIELRQSEQQYHKMIEEVEDYAILMLDKNGNILTWNEGAKKIKGYKSNEIIGKHFRVFYMKEDQEAHLPERLIEQATVEGKAVYEGWRLRKDGSKFWGSIVITAIHDDNNEVIGFSKVTRDLTERKNAEDQLMNYAMQLDKKNRELQMSNKELQSFSYVASHDLQEPLRKIQTFGKRILESERDHLTESGRDSFDRMINSAERMQKLIDDLLAFSRAHIPERELELVNLNEILSETKVSVEEAISEAQCKIESDNLPTIMAIPFQMQQLFHNLLSNAIKYRSKKRPLRIRITDEIISAHKMKSFARTEFQRYHKISLEDNGIGFDQKYSEKIFEIFQRLHGKSDYPGTGIGLAICKKIVENHDGFITAKGAPNEGATFDLYFPVTI